MDSLDHQQMQEQNLANSSGFPDSDLEEYKDPAKPANPDQSSIPITMSDGRLMINTRPKDETDTGNNESFAESQEQTTVPHISTETIKNVEGDNIHMWADYYSTNKVTPDLVVSSKVKEDEEINFQFNQSKAKQRRQRLPQAFE